MKNTGKREFTMIYGIESMKNPLLLPLLRYGVKTHYEGSIDKAGDNADYDWWLYQDSNGEWVLFDCIGAGCIYNFVQHRYPDSTEPTFRFYFDGETEPRFTIKHSQFGEVYPFSEPLASRYIGPLADGRGPIRVVRSFVPMPFAKSCRITSDIKLEGYDRAKGHGGWGHVIYQTYPDDADIKTFSKADDYKSLIDFWKKSGTNSPVIDFGNPTHTKQSDVTVFAGGTLSLFDDNAAGLISGIRIHVNGFTTTDLSELYIRAAWDGHEKPDVYTPLGCFFTNELGYHAVNYLYSGMNTDGEFYNYIPMPYLHSATIQLVNHGRKDINIDYACVTSSAEFNNIYADNPFGYFRTSDYYTRKHTEGSDSIIARLSGHGHVVGSIITAHAETDETYASCEGDVRIHFDKIRTPQIESDGSESYSCYGWGFPTPPEYNPSSGYDGNDHRNWSMTRWLTGDVTPFLTDCTFGIESGGNNDCYLEHSGMIFYYGRDGEAAECIGKYHHGDTELVSFFEGDNDHIPISGKGEYGAISEFKVTLTANGGYLILRRMSDQSQGRQSADVYIDGVRAEFPWYFADCNTVKRWLEDEYTVSERYLSGKTDVTIKIVPTSPSWNSYGYTVYQAKML